MNINILEMMIEIRAVTKTVRSYSNNELNKVGQNMSIDDTRKSIIDGSEVFSTS